MVCIGQQQPFDPPPCAEKTSSGSQPILSKAPHALCFPRSPGLPLSSPPLPLDSPPLPLGAKREPPQRLARRRKGSLFHLTWIIETMSLCLCSCQGENACHLISLLSRQDQDQQVSSKAKRSRHVQRVHELTNNQKEERKKESKKVNESEREKARGVPLWHRLCSFCHSLHLLGKRTYTRIRTRSRTSQTEGYWCFFFVSCFYFPPTPSIYLQGIRSSFFSSFLLCSYPIELTQQVLASNHPFFFPPFYLSTFPPFHLSLSPFLHT